MRHLPESWCHAACRAAHRWQPVVGHREPRPDFARLGWLARKRLDLAALLIGLCRPATWRATLLLALALLLTQLLRERWSLDGPASQLGQCLLALAVLPRVAHARQAILRLLLMRTARSAGGQGHGVL